MEHAVRSVVMLKRSAAGVLRVTRKQQALVLLTLVVASTSSCAEHMRDRTTDELIAVVQESESFVSGESACDAAYNVGLRKATEAVDALIAALSISAADCLVDALAEIGDVRAVEPLVGAFDAVPDPFAEDGAKFDSADEALVMVGTAAVDPLLDIAATSEDELELDRVANVLGRIRDPRAEAFLIERLKALSVVLSATDLTDGIAEYDVTHSQEIAATALARIFSDQVDHLIPLLQSKETVAIAYGLIGLGEPGTEGVLIDALKQYGDLTLAELYLNSNNPGEPDLDSAAVEWAWWNGYEMAPWHPQPNEVFFDGYWGALEDLPIEEDLEG
jgi:HEAT repeat protein